MLVDFPLCLSAQGGNELFNLAENKGDRLDNEYKYLILKVIKICWQSLISHHLSISALGTLMHI